MGKWNLGEIPEKIYFFFHSNGHGNGLFTARNNKKCPGVIHRTKKKPWYLSLMQQSPFALFGAFELGVHEGQAWEQLTFAWYTILVTSSCIFILYSLVLSEIYPSSYLIMSKSRSKYLKKHKFRGNQYSKKHTRVSKGDGFPSTTHINTRNSASAWKMPLPKQSKSPDCGIPSTDPSITRFRFVNMEILDSVFRILPCEEPFECRLILQEQTL